MSFLHETKDGEGRPQRIWMIRQGQQVTPNRKRKLDDGTVVRERLTAKPYRRMVNAKGDIVQVCLTEGASVVQLTSSYAKGREEQKIRDGFIPADQCALANRLLPKALARKGDKPCEGWTDEFGMAKRVGSNKKPVEPCEHTQRVIEYRKQKAAERKQRLKEKQRSEDVTYQLLKQLSANAGGGSPKRQTEL